MNVKRVFKLKDDKPVVSYYVVNNMYVPVSENNRMYKEYVLNNNNIIDDYSLVLKEKIKRLENELYNCLNNIIVSIDGVSIKFDDKTQNHYALVLAIMKDNDKANSITVDGELVLLDKNKLIELSRKYIIKKNDILKKYFEIKSNINEYIDKKITLCEKDK